MFGYIKPCVPELRVGEYELFRALYCGVCRSMGRHTGILSRFTLSYDYVFLAAVRMALTDTTPTCARRWCPAHPMQKRNAAEDNETLAYTAGAAACMLGEKFSDDAADESGFRRLLSSAGVPLANLALRRAGEKNAPDAARVHALTAELYEMEKSDVASVDETAEAFGGALAYVFSCGLDGTSAVVAGEIGRAVGRFVYICDAADDLPEDLRKGRYNPLLRLWGDRATEEKDGKIVTSAPVAESVRIATRIDLERLGLAVELLPTDSPLLPIIRNVVYLGMPNAMDEILKKRTE